MIANKPEALAVLDHLAVDISRIRALPFVPAEVKAAVDRLASLLLFLIERIDDHA